MKAHSSHFHCWGEVPPDRPHGEEQAWAGRSAIKCRARQGCSSWASTKKGFVGAEMWLQVWWAEDREAARPVEGGYKTREGNWKEKKRVKPEKKKKSTGVQWVFLSSSFFITWNVDGHARIGKRNRVWMLHDSAEGAGQEYKPFLIRPDIQPRIRIYGSLWKKSLTAHPGPMDTQLSCHEILGVKKVTSTFLSPFLPNSIFCQPTWGSLHKSSALSPLCSP